MLTVIFAVRHASDLRLDSPLPGTHAFAQVLAASIRAESFEGISILRKPTVVNRRPFIALCIMLLRYIAMA